MHIRYLTASTIVGLMLSTSALADPCSTYAPANSATVDCLTESVTDTTPIIGSAATDVTVHVSDHNFDVTGAPVIDLGDDATVNINSGSVASQTHEAIRFQAGGQINFNAGALGTTGSGDAITYAGSTATDMFLVYVGNGDQDLATLGDVDFGDSIGIINLLGDGVLAGVIDGGGGGTDVLNLTGATTALNDVDLDNVLNFETFTKNGTGTWTVTGTNASITTATINGGTLNLNGTLTNASVAVESGGTLGGTGTLDNLTANAGATIAPGNSIGTLNVTGDLTLEDDSTYNVELDDTGASDLIDATGNVVINGAALNITRLPGTYTGTQSYTILQGASIAGTFDPVTDTLFIDNEMQYNANDVQIESTYSSLSAVAADSAQAAVADALEDDANEATSAFFELTDTSVAQDALEQLSGEHLAATSPAVAQAIAQSRALVAQRQQSRYFRDGTGNLAALAPSSGDNDGVYTAAYIEHGDSDAFFANREAWIQFTGSVGKSDADGTAPSSDRRGYGTAMGMDAAYGDQIVGVYGAWNSTTIDTSSQNGESEVTGYQLGVYGTRQAGVARISGGASLGYNEIDSTRAVSFPGFAGTAEGETTGYSGAAFIEAGVPFDAGFAAIEPYAGASYSYNYIDGYTEENGGAANLIVDSSSDGVPSTILGVRAGSALAYTDGRVATRGHVAWQHNYGDTDNDMTMRFATGNTPFSVNGAARDRDVLMVGAGLEAATDEGVNLYADYDGALSKDNKDHSVTGGLNAKF